MPTPPDGEGGELGPLADPVFARAVERATRACERAEKRWRAEDEADEDAADAADEAKQHGRSALAHLEAGRVDEARAAAELAVELDEQHGSGEVWRDFALLVEEAAETI